MPAGVPSSTEVNAMTAMQTPARRNLNDDACWDAVLERRPSADGLFVIAVRTTGIFCRPTCPARPPKRENVAFFASPAEAAAAGYRPCKRCHPADPQRPEHLLVRDICRRLDDADRVVTLDELATEFSMSKFHLQRVFRRAVGVSPRAYADARRLERAKEALRNGNGVADAVYGAGYGSGSRLYERASAQLGMTPGSYRRRGAGMRIAYTIVTTTYGRMLVGATERGVASVGFADNDERLESYLRGEYSGAEIVRDDALMQPWIKRVLRVVEEGEAPGALPLDIRATSFKLRVWQELQRIPRGQTRTYSDIARAIGAPNAARAVGNACGTNPVAYVIPCHRVVREDGSLGGYGWGIERKKQMLRREGALAKER